MRTRDVVPRVSVAQCCARENRWRKHRRVFRYSRRTAAVVAPRRVCAISESRRVCACVLCVCVFFADGLEDSLLESEIRFRNCDI